MTDILYETYITILKTPVTQYGIGVMKLLGEAEEYFTK